MPRPNSQLSPAVSSFERTVSQALGPISAGSTLVVAVSGGADSTALLVSLSHLCSRMGFSIVCIHINHGLRPEIEGREDAAAVSSLCDSLSVKLCITTADPGYIAGCSALEGRGIESAARDFRMDALRREAERLGADRIALGHTRDDSLEHVLIRVLRGSGPAGLAALPMERGRIIRPLLQLGRSEVLAYLDAMRIGYRTDSTNADPSFLRNRVRLRLVPLLDREFPGWQGSILSVARTQAKTAAFLSAEAGRRIVWAGDKQSSNELTSDEANFFNQDVILREEALFQVVDALSHMGSQRNGYPRADPEPRGRREPRREAIAVFASGTEKAMDLGPVRVERRGGRIVATIPSESGPETGFVLVVREPGVTVVDDLSFLVEQVDTTQWISCLPNEVVGETDNFPDRVGVVLPCVVRSCTPQDRRLVRVSTKDGTVPPETFALVQDSRGIAVLIARDGKGKPVLKGLGFKGPTHKDAPAGYARRAFFSIL